MATEKPNLAVVDNKVPINTIRRRHKKSLAEWIAEARTDADKDGKCVAIALTYVVGGGGAEKEIHVTRFGAGKDWSDDDLGKMFKEKAETHAQDLPGTHTFNLLAFYSPDSDRKDNKGLEPLAVLPFTVQGRMQDGFDSNGVLTTESADGKGALAQIMRMVSDTYNRQCAKDGLLFEQNQYLINFLARDNKELHEENREMFAIFRELMIKERQADHDMKIKVMEFERQTVERKMLYALAPAAANTLTGKEIFPQSTADTALIEALATSEGVTPETLAKVAQILGLSPAVMGMIAQRLAQVLEQKALEAKRSKLLGANHPDPTADAGGNSPQLGSGE